MLRHSSNSQTPFARGTGAWFHDTLYLAASLFVWNWRKSRYRKSRGSMRCPCQSLSDSGREGESRCEASYYLKDPRRFSLVCPALKSTPDGLRCHHRLEDVRPYWGRAIFAVLVAIMLLYGLVVTSVFGVVRAQGTASARWVDCAWPPNWSNLSTARAIQHRTDADQALAAGDVRAAIRSLSRAVNAQPDRWSDGLLLAKLYEQIGQFAASEALFQSLARRFPEYIDQISAVRHDAVLASHRYDSLQELAFDRIAQSDPGHSVSWVETLLMATALSDQPSAIWTRFPTHCDQLTRDHRVLLSVVASPSDPNSGEPSVASLDHVFENPQLTRLRWKAFWLAGRSDSALAALQQDESFIPRFESSLARWLIAIPSVPAFATTSQWEALCRSASSPQEIGLLLATALDARTFVPLRVITDRIQSDHVDLIPSLWLLASLQEQTGLANLLAEKLNQREHSTLPVITAKSLPSDLVLVLDRFPIPRDFLYALVRHSQLAP